MNPEGEANAWGSGGSRYERRGGAMMRRARRAILGAKSGLFELQGATGESDKVR